MAPQRGCPAGDPAVPALPAVPFVNLEHQERNSNTLANEQFDVTIIGSGPGGYVAAIRAGQLGLKVAMVEKDTRLGGTCTLRGSISTKQMLMSPPVYEQMQHADDF